jgi:hypothetical protein
MKTNPHEPINPCPEGPNGFKGFTKREYFAATILTGLLAQEEGWSLPVVTDYAVKVSDALIAALNKK